MHSLSLNMRDGRWGVAAEVLHDQRLGARCTPRLRMQWRVGLGACSSCSWIVQRFTSLLSVVELFPVLQHDV